VIGPKNGSLTNSSTIIFKLNYCPLVADVSLVNLIIRILHFF